MAPQRENPAAGRTADGVRGASRAAGHSDHNTTAKTSKPSLTVRLGDRTLTVKGRMALTLAQCGNRGFTSGEASPFGVGAESGALYPRTPQAWLSDPDAVGGGRGRPSRSLYSRPARGSVGEVCGMNGPVAVRSLPLPVPLGGKSEVRLVLETVNNQTRGGLGISLYYRLGPCEVHRPTKKGVALPVEALPDLVAAEATARALGLLGGER